MKLLRGLGGLKTTTLMMLALTAQSLCAGDNSSNRKINTSALFNDIANTCDQTSVAISAKTTQEKQQAALAITSALLKMAAHLAAKSNQQNSSDVRGGESTADPNTIALSQALYNFAADLFNHKNAYVYVKEQLTLLFNALSEKLPGFIMVAAENQINAVLNSTTATATPTPVVRT